MQQVKLFLPVVMGDLLQNVNVVSPCSFPELMTDASGPAHCSLLLPYVSEKIIVCLSNIATNTVESLPGI